MNYEEWTGMRAYTPNYPIRKQRKRIFLKFLEQQKESGLKRRVLDAGCFKGDMCGKIKEMGFETHGIDALKENIIEAKKRHNGVDFRIGELGSKLPYKNNFFDVIWAGDVIEHVYDTIGMFSEFNRVLKKGGFLVASTPMHNFWKMLLITCADLDRHFHPEHRHIRFYTKNNFRRILDKYGFSVSKEFYLGRVRPIANNMLFISRKTRDIDWNSLPAMLR